MNPDETLPAEGGSYTRDPDTGALTPARVPQPTESEE